MTENLNKNYKNTSGNSAGKRPPKKHTFRNTVIIAALLIAALLLFVFGINKWHIEFRLIGESPVTRECGEPYKDDGAEAEVTGSVLSFVHHPISVSTSTERVNIHEPGTYTVTYSAKFLWMSASTTRSVVIVDTTPPVIELAHIDDYYTLPHHPYVEEGFTATDNHDGDITSLVKSEERDGKVYYTVTDQAGNTASAEREIFYDDRNAPVFHFPSGEEAFIFKGETWEDDVRAEDDADALILLPHSDQGRSQGVDVLQVLPVGDRCIGVLPAFLLPEGRPVPELLRRGLDHILQVRNGTGVLVNLCRVLAGLDGVDRSQGVP